MTDKSKLIAYAVALVIIALGLAACAGFDIGDVVRVQTPHAIQQQTGLSSSVSLNTAESEYRAWYESTQRAAAQWKQNIERGGEIAGLLRQITLGAVEQVGPTLAGVPVLGPLLPLLTGLGGLFLRRPGDASKDRLRKEKEASFNAGLNKAKEST